MEKLLWLKHSLGAGGPQHNPDTETRPSAGPSGSRMTLPPGCGEANSTDAEQELLLLSWSLEPREIPDDLKDSGTSGF